MQSSHCLCAQSHRVWASSILQHLNTETSIALVLWENSYCLQPKERKKQSEPTEVTHCHCHNCWNTSPAATVCSHPLVGLNGHTASVNECQSSTQRNAMKHLCFIYTSIPGAILSDCPFASIRHTATKCDEILLGGSVPAAIPPASPSDVVGQHHRTGGTTFGAALTLAITACSNHFYSHRLTSDSPGCSQSASLITQPHGAGEGGADVFCLFFFLSKLTFCFQKGCLTLVWYVTMKKCVSWQPSYILSLSVLYQGSKLLPGPAAQAQAW